MRHRGKVPLKIYLISANCASDRGILIGPFNFNLTLGGINFLGIETTPLGVLTLTTSLSKDRTSPSIVISLLSDAKAERDANRKLKIILICFFIFYFSPDLVLSLSSSIPLSLSMTGSIGRPFCCLTSASIRSLSHYL